MVWVSVAAIKPGTKTSTAASAASMTAMLSPSPINTRRAAAPNERPWRRYGIIPSPKPPITPNARPSPMVQALDKLRPVPSASPAISPRPQPARQCSVALAPGIVRHAGRRRDEERAEDHGETAFLNRSERQACDGRSEDGHAPHQHKPPVDVGAAAIQERGPGQGAKDNEVHHWD